MDTGKGDDMIEVNGEQLSEKESAELIRMLCNDAKQVAGVFHGMNRSKKFRANWPSEYVFADANWKNFMEATRKMYADRLNDPKCLPADARKMHLALVLEAQIAKGVETDNRLQLSPNTQQFVGDPFENKKIVETFGKQSNTLKEVLMGSSALETSTVH